MALAVDSEMPSNAGFESAGGPASPQTFSFTNTAGTVLYLVVGVGVISTLTVTYGAVSYNGVAMTQVLEKAVNGSTGGKVAVYRLLSPATGSNTVSIAWSVNNADFNAERRLWAACISFAGNHATTPEAQTNSGEGNNSDPTLGLTGVTAGNIVLSVAGTGSNIDSGPGAGTLSALMNIDDQSSMNNGALYRQAGSGSITHAYDQNSGAERWAEIMVEIAADGASGETYEKAGLGVIGP